MSDMIYLNFPAVMGDGREAASFKARYGSPATNADMHRLIADLQITQARLRRDLEREKQKRLEAEKQLAAQRPSVEECMARLFAQVAGTGFTKRKAA